MTQVSIRYIAVALAATLLPRRAAAATRSRSPHNGCRERRRRRVQINGAGATFPNPIYSKWFCRVQQAAPEHSHQLSVDRIRRRHPADHQPDGVLRRHRRSDDRRAVEVGARADPAPADGARRGRAGLQHPGRDRGVEVHGTGARRHLSRQDQEVERPGDREAEPRREAAGHRHHGRPPLGRLGHDLHLRGLPLEGLARLQDARSASTRRSNGRSASAAKATKASRVWSRRRRDRSATSS